MSAPPRTSAKQLAVAIAAVAAAIAAPLLGAAMATTPAPAGVWLWDTGDAAVEFHPCGDALCGRIVWVREENAPGAGVLQDTHNPDPGLRARRICGLDYITGLTRTEDGDWRHGRVYDYHSGAAYDLDLDSVTQTEVRMRGYRGLRLLGANLRLVRPESGTSLACKTGA